MGIKLSLQGVMTATERHFSFIYINAATPRCLVLGTPFTTDILTLHLPSGNIQTTLEQSDLLLAIF